MKIIDALKRDSYNLRVDSGDSWLVYNELDEEWTVHQRKYYQKKTRTLIRTENEEEAVAVLVKD